MSAVFSRATLDFLAELAEHNERSWFAAHRARYETEVRAPALALIAGLAGPVSGISERFLAVPKAVGGSLFRIQRDTRFSKDKRPYKPWIGMRFYHERGRDGDAPLFYLHVQPGASFVGGGLWHPQTKALRAVRDYLLANPASWRALSRRALESGYRWGGESLSRPPRGYEAAHELIEDLKRKDFILSRELSDEEVLADGFAGEAVRHFKQIAPLVDWLCGALDIDF